MARLTKAFLAVFALSLSGPLLAAGLPVPQGFQAETTQGGLTLRWQAVEGAGLYRVAIFDAPEADGKRPLLAAVWVKGVQYVYGQTVTVPKAGKYPSTKPLPLPAGRRLRAMVAAAASDGSDKGEWAGTDVDAVAGVKVAATTPSPEATATPSPAFTSTSTPTPGVAPKEAELEIQGGSEEFKQSPEAAVLDVDDSPAEAGASAAAGAAAGAGALANAATSGVSNGGTSASTDSKAALANSVGEAKGLISAGRFEQAEAAYRALLEKDPQNADYWEGLGDSFAGRKMKLEAKESYEKALTLNKAKTHLKDWIEKNVRH